MRKLYMIASFCLLGNVLMAQGRASIKAGVNMFWLTSDKDVAYDYKSPNAGFTAGVSYEFYLSKKFSIQPELNYSNQNAKETYYGTSLNLSYMQTPLLVRYHVAENFAFYAGPQLSYLTGAEIKSDDEGTFGIKDELNKTDFGIAWGIGYEPAHKGITAEVRIYNGLMNTYKALYDGDVKTRPLVASVMVGYIFGDR